MRTRARLLLSTAFSLVLAAAQAQGFGGINGLHPSSPCGGHPGWDDNGCAGSNLWVQNPATIYPNMFGTLGPGGAGTGTGNVSGGFYFAQRPTQNEPGIDYPVGSANPATLTAVTSSIFPTPTGASCAYQTGNIINCVVTADITIQAWNFTDFAIYFSCASPHNVTLINDDWLAGPTSGVTPTALVQWVTNQNCRMVGHNLTFDANMRALWNYLYSNAPSAQSGPCSISITCFNATKAVPLVMTGDASSVNSAYTSSMYIDYSVFVDIGGRAFQTTTDGNIIVNNSLVKDMQGVLAHSEAGLSYAFSSHTQAATLSADGTDPDTFSIGAPSGGITLYIGEPFFYNTTSVGDLNTQRNPLWITSVVNAATGTFQFSQTHGGTPYVGSSGGTTTLLFSTGGQPSVIMNGDVIWNSSAQEGQQDQTGQIVPGEGPAEPTFFHDLTMNNNLEIVDQPVGYINLVMTSNPTAGQTVTFQACSGPPGNCVGSGSTTTVTFGTDVTIGATTSISLSNLVAFLNTNAAADPLIGNYIYMTIAGSNIIARGPYTVQVKGTALNLGFPPGNQSSSIEQNGGIVITGQLQDVNNWRAPYGVSSGFCVTTNGGTGAWNATPNYWNANTPTVSGNVNLLGTTADPHIDGSPCYTTNY